MAESAKWYVIHTYSGYENAVKTSIEKLVNGRAEDVPTANGYWVIARKWNSGDEVFFDLPMTPRFIHRTYEPGRATGSTKRSRPVRQIAVQRGPLIYATSAAEARTHYFTPPHHLTITPPQHNTITTWTNFFFLMPTHSSIVPTTHS